MSRLEHSVRVRVGRAFRDLLVGQKLAVIGTLFCLPPMMLLYLLVAEKEISIGIAREEQHGVEYLQRLGALLEDVPRRQAASASQSAGSMGASKRSCGRSRRSTSSTARS